MWIVEQQLTYVRGMEADDFRKYYMTISKFFTALQLPPPRDVLRSSLYSGAITSYREPKYPVSSSRAVLRQARLLQ
jgi:hypothetical protein